MKLKATVLSIWSYRLLILVGWGLLGWGVLIHLPPGDDGVVGAGLIIGAITFALARGLVRFLWMCLGLIPPEAFG